MKIASRKTEEIFGGTIKDCEGGPDCRANGDTLHCLKRPGRVIG